MVTRVSRGGSETWHGGGLYTRNVGVIFGFASNWNPATATLRDHIDRVAEPMLYACFQRRFIAPVIRCAIEASSPLLERAYGLEGGVLYRFVI